MPNRPCTGFGDVRGFVTSLLSRDLRGRFSFRIFFCTGSRKGLCTLGKEVCDALVHAEGEKTRGQQCPKGRFLATVLPTGPRRERLKQPRWRRRTLAGLRAKLPKGASKGAGFQDPSTADSEAAAIGSTHVELDAGGGLQSG